MNIFQISKKNILYILLGIILIYALTLLTNFIMYKAFLYASNSFSALILSISSWFPYLIGTGFTGYKMKEKGWLYGAITACTLFLIFLVINQITTSLHPLPKAFPGKANIQLNVFIKDIKHLPFLLLAGALGGWLGETIRKKLHSESSHTHQNTNLQET